MTTFDELGLRPELVEGLAAEGIEFPTALQAEAVPALRKGHSALVRGGPGAGVLVAWAAPLLDRLEPVPGGPVTLVAVASEAMALELARSLVRLGAAAGHRVASLGGPFALPGHADVLFGTPSALLAGLREGEVSASGLGALVLSGAGAMLSDAAIREDAEALVEHFEGEEIQRVVVAEPVTAEVRKLVDAQLTRAVFLPSDAGQVGEGEDAPIQRGTLRLRILEVEEGLALANLAGELLSDGARHLLLFFRSEDRAADLGDLLTLHGYLAGEPGDAQAPIWLATEGMSARRALTAAEVSGEDVLAVSVDPPPDADELDRRHGGSAEGGVILARARELPHLRRIAGEAGYTVAPFPGPIQAHVERKAFTEALEAVIEGEDLTPFHFLLEPAVERWGATEVAAALAALFRRQEREKAGIAGPAGTGVAASPGSSGPLRPGGPGAPMAFVRLFLSVGSRDGIGPGELLGAITGEAGVRGEQVGRIDVRDTFSRVEVEEGVAATILQALNGISIRGRSVRADYDRSTGRATGASTPSAPRGDRGQGGSRGPGTRGPGSRGPGGGGPGGRSGGPRGPGPRGSGGPGGRPGGSRRDG